MTDCSCTNFPTSLGNVTFGASVGIGTTAPTQLLHIASNGAFPGVLIQGTDPASGVNGCMLASDGRQYNLGVGGYPGITVQGSDPASGVNGLMVKADGRQYNVGVGGSQNITVANKFTVFDATAGLFRLVVDQSGNVGVGTVSPQQALDVAGTIRSGTGIISGGTIILPLAAVGGLKDSSGTKLIADENGC